MRIADQDDIGFPSLPSIRVALEPAYSAIQSLFLLSKSEHVPGVADWVTQTVQAMSEAERQTNLLVMFGMHYIVTPEESWSSLPAFIDHLSRTRPEILRDKMLKIYDSVPVKEEFQAEALNLAQALESAENFVRYLQQRFEPENMDEEIETRVYHYLIDLPAMQKLIVEHLWNMWKKYLKDEWERTRPVLQEVVQAYRNVDFGKMTKQEAATLITGRKDIPEMWCLRLEQSERVVYVPHPHCGPYIRKSRLVEPDGKETLVIFFGARLPEELSEDVPALGRAEIVTRLSALADDVRLSILRLIAENGEMRSSEIITALDLSQSAASRHLTQLSATGYINERRCDGAKCYALNHERISDTLHAIEHFLLIPERSTI